MATIQKRKAKDGKPRYRVIVRKRGHYATRTFRTKAQAQDWATATEDRIAKGSYARHAEAESKTIADLIDRYLEQVLPDKPKEASRGDQERHLRWWRKEIGRVSLARATPALLAEKRDQLRYEKNKLGKPVRGPATVNRYMGSLSHPFSIAVREWEWLSENPMSKVGRLPEPRGRDRFLSDDERGQLFEACRKTEDRRLYPLVVVATYSGARQGELLALRWRDIDWERGVAIIHDSKNTEKRAVPIVGPAREALEEMRRVRRLDTDLIFANEAGVADWNQSARPLWRSWTTAVKRAEIEDLRFHDLRHTAASYLAMSGATLADIAEILGHKTLAMVKRYSHLAEGHTVKVATRMAEKFSGNGGVQ